jgi:hypothetical protein
MALKMEDWVSMTLSKPSKFYLELTLALPTADFRAVFADKKVMSQTFALVFVPFIQNTALLFLSNKKSIVFKVLSSGCCFSSPILLSEQIVRKFYFILIFFPPSEDLSKFSCTKQGIKKVSPYPIKYCHL